VSILRKHTGALETFSGDETDLWIQQTRKRTQADCCHWSDHVWERDQWQTNNASVPRRMHRNNVRINCNTSTITLLDHQHQRISHTYCMQ